MKEYKLTDNIPTHDLFTFTRQDRTVAKVVICWEYEPNDITWKQLFDRANCPTERIGQVRIVGENALSGHTYLYDMCQGKKIYETGDTKGYA